MFHESTGLWYEGKVESADDLNGRTLMSVSYARYETEDIIYQHGNYVLNK